MSLAREFFGRTSDGAEVYRYTITNTKGMSVSLIDYGAAIQSIIFPDKNGVKRDVTVGFDSIDGFEHKSDYQGVIAGPYANRISGGRFTIDGKEYDLVKNEDGVKTLHSCGEYTHTVWSAAPVDANSIVFSYTRQDGLNGYPGAIEAEITYSLDEACALTIEYSLVSDKKTYINPTNHTYFNLGGFGSGDILSHVLKINASEFTPIDEASIPIGGCAEVEGTPFDFREPKEIGKDIGKSNIQLKNAGGYDHNFCIDGESGTLREAAAALCPESGIKLTVSTDLPGIQFYSGNYLKGVTGKKGIPMQKRGGFCLETQYYPDTPNHPEFPSCLFDAGEKYRSKTVFAFSL